MRTLFVVEAGFKAGLGHLLRSRALLLELRARGHTVDLWLHGDPAALTGRDWPAQMQVFESAESDPNVAACDGIGRLLQRSRYDWLVIDGYGFSGYSMCERLAALGPKLLMLDDLAARELKADIVLNQNTADADVYAAGRVGASRFLLGPQYALIDRAYIAARDAQRTHGELRHLLVTFGGVDRYGRTQRVVDLVSRYTAPLDIAVAAGPYYPYLDELQSRRGTHSLRVMQNAPDLADEMRQCDLMVTAGGSTVWQACCSGVPMVVLQTVDNQRLVIRTLSAFGAALCLDVSTNPERGAGIPEDEFVEMFRRAALPATRAGLSANAIQLVDGHGTARVAGIMESWR